jgi:hypothetical protein
MNKGVVLAAVLSIVTVAFVVIGTIWPGPSALAYAGGQGVVHSTATPEAAVANLGSQIQSQAWSKAYASLANKGQFTQTEFVHDLTGFYPGLRTYATLDKFEVRPLHASDNEADVQLKLFWSTVVGISVSSRNLHMVRNGDHWQAKWPIEKEPVVPPQVIPVNYLRWDVIYRGPGDDCRHARRPARRRCGGLG